jgi:hypothetical protein
VPIYCSQRCKQAAYRDRVHEQHQANIGRLREVLRVATPQRLADRSLPPWVRDLVAAAERVVGQ